MPVPTCVDKRQSPFASLERPEGRCRRINLSPGPHLPDAALLRQTLLLRTALKRLHPTKIDVALRRRLARTSSRQERCAPERHITAGNRLTKGWPQSVRTLEAVSYSSK